MALMDPQAQASAIDRRFFEILQTLQKTEYFRLNLSGCRQEDFENEFVTKDIMIFNLIDQERFLGLGRHSFVICKYPSGVKCYWYDREKRWNGDNQDISFEEVLEQVSPSLQSQLLYHLDIFRQDFIACSAC